jgi:hypothetical protein
MRHFVIFMAIAALLLGGCGRPNLSEMAVGSELYEAGDLPAFIVPGEIKDELWPSLRSVTMPQPQKATYQVFKRDEKVVGLVQVLLYEKRKDMSEANLAIHKQGWRKAMENEGSLSASSTSSLCYATIEVVLVANDQQFQIDNQTLDRYMERLKTRLEPIVCNGYDAWEATE